MMLDFSNEVMEKQKININIKPEDLKKLDDYTKKLEQINISIEKTIPQLKDSLEKSLPEETSNELKTIVNTIDELYSVRSSTGLVGKLKKFMVKTKLKNVTVSDLISRLQQQENILKDFYISINSMFTYINQLKNDAYKQLEYINSVLETYGYHIDTLKQLDPSTYADDPHIYKLVTNLYRIYKTKQATIENIKFMENIKSMLVNYGSQIEDILFELKTIKTNALVRLPLLSFIDNMTRSMEDTMKVMHLSNEFNNKVLEKIGIQTDNVRETVTSHIRSSTETSEETLRLLDELTRKTYQLYTEVLAAKNETIIKLRQRTEAMENEVHTM